MDVDMRVQAPVPSASSSTMPLGPAPNDPRLRGPTAPKNITAAVAAGKANTTAPAGGGATITTKAAAVKSQTISIDSSSETISGSSVLSSDVKTPTQIIPTGFYIDHNHGIESDKTKPAHADSKTVTEATKPSNSAKKVTSTGGWSEVSLADVKSESVLARLKKTVPVLDAGSEKTGGDKQDHTGATTGDPEAGTKIDPGFDIVSHLQAEISGKSVTSKDDANKASDLEKDGKKAVVPGIASGLAGQADGSEAGQAGIQLPTALKSLFTSLPPTAGEEPGKEDREPVTAADSQNLVPTYQHGTAEDEPQDVDMREPGSTGPILPGFEGYQPERSHGEHVEEKREKEKKTKSFMGFDYDSDSSNESFDGFDDDGTKKLSPRKRKLVNKGKAGHSTENVESEDTEEIQDVDLRSMPMMGGGSDIKDVDERLAPGSSAASGLVDVDHRRPPFPPPTGIRMPQYMGTSQPPPPGEEWDAPPMPGPPLYPPGLAPPGIDNWGSTGPGAMPQPPLPSEPPAPKPPEPPVKKSKSNDDRKKDVEKDNGNRTINLGPMSSDQRLAEIVLKIANKDNVENPPLLGPRQRGLNAPMPFPGPPPMPPLPMPPMPTGMPPVLPPASWPDPTTGIGSSGWLGPPPPPLVNTQSPMIPPILPPQLQPGVAPPPSLPNMAPPSAPGKAGPPSLLDLPSVLPTPSLKATPPSQQQSNPGNNSPSLVGHTEGPSHDNSSTDKHSEQTPPTQGHAHHGRRSHERERDSDWRRHHDRYRDSRDYDRGHRSRDRRDSRERDRGHGERDRGRKDSDRDRRHSKSNRY